MSLDYASQQILEEIEIWQNTCKPSTQFLSLVFQSYAT